MLVPDPAKLLEPHIDLLQSRRLDPVEAAGTFRSDRGESVFPQHPKVLGDGWLRNPELRLDNRGNGAGWLLTVGEQFHNPPSYRVTKHIERMHVSIMQPLLI